MRTLLRVTFVAAGCVLAANSVGAHGGTYAGPGDTVPAGGGGGTGGTPGVPGTGGGGTGPGPNQPAPGGRTGGPGGQPGAGGSAQTGGGDDQPDLTRWQFWWELNKDAYIQLRAHLYSRGPQSHSAEFYLGQGEQQQVRDDLRPSEADIRSLIVPALLESLEREGAQDIVTGAMLALARIGDESGEDGQSLFAPALARRLGDPSQEVSESAALALGVLGNEANVALLIDLLRNDRAALAELGVRFNRDLPERTRAFAAYGLHLIGRNAEMAVRGRIVEALTQLLERPDVGLRKRDVPVACVLALGGVPLESDPLFVPLAEGADGVRPTRVDSREDQVLFLLSMFEDPRGEALVRAHAPRSLARLVMDLPSEHWLKQRVARALTAVLAEHVKESNFVRQGAALALGQVGDCDDDPLDVSIRETLVRTQAGIADLSVKRFALISLAQVCGRGGTGGWTALEGKKSPRALLLAKLADAQSNERCWAALALGVMEFALAAENGPVSADVQAALTRYLEDAKQPDEIGAASIAVGLVRATGARGALLERLEQPGDLDARGYAALGLGLLGETASTERIQAVVARSKFAPELLRQAAIALGLLGDGTAVANLVEMLGASKSTASQAAIASALGQIGDKRSVEPLVAMLRDQQKSELARGFAAAALGIVADKELLPWRASISADLDYRANTETLTTPKDGTGILDIL